jgi:hypothetical protein
LLAALSASRWRRVGDAGALTYDAPFTIRFLRRDGVTVTMRRRMNE